MTRENLAETIYYRRQAGFIPICIFAVNKIICRRFIQQTRYFAKMLNGFVFFGFSAQGFDDGADTALLGAISVALFGGSSHPLDTIFMNWHYFVSSH